MTVTTEPAYYDDAMTAARAPAMLPLDESPWRPLYCEAASWIAAHEEVVDLGCGTGRFIHALRLSGHYAPVEGVDFSTAALQEAERYLLERDAASDVTATTRDLREWRPEPLRAGNTVYVCLEVLEHLELDIELVWRIPPGHRLVFSVPNFDSAAHLRKVTTVGELWRRYGQLVTFRRWSLVELNGGRKAVHLVDTVRRADSWA